MGVLRRRVLRCKGSDVVGIEDDLMVAEAPPTTSWSSATAP